MAEDNDMNNVAEKENTLGNHDIASEGDVELIDLSNEERNKESDTKGKEEEEVTNGEGDEELDEDEALEESELGEVLDGVLDEEEKENEGEAENGTSEELMDEASAINSKANSDDEILLSDDDEDEEAEALNLIDDGESQEKSEASEDAPLPAPETTAASKPNGVVKALPAEDPKEDPNVIDVDDDDDEDEVQDLSTKAPALEDLMPKLTLELTGFPTFLNGVVTLGDCLAINKRSKGDIDIDKEYSILDCPSQVVPLIIKKTNTFPAKLKADKEEKPAVVTPAPPTSNSNNKNMLTISDFYSSSIGKFLIGVGLSRVKQWYHKDAINKVRKQIRKEGEAEDLVDELKKQQEYLNICRGANASYLFPTEKCEHCEFRTEFKSVLANHLLYPHMTSRKEYKCNYCQFSSRDSKVIVTHVNSLHEKKCLIELPPQLYECPICPYESGVKSKAATHIAKCLKFFAPDKLLVNKDDYFPTITPKPITQEDIKIYEATLQALRFAALNPQNKVPQIPGLPAGLQQQMYSIQQQNPRSGPGRPQKTPSNRIGKIQPFMNLNQVGNIKNLSPQLYQMLSNAPHGQQFLQNPSALAASLGGAAGGPGAAGQPQNALSFMNKHQQMLKMSASANSAGQGGAGSRNQNKNSLIAKGNHGHGHGGAATPPSNNAHGRGGVPAGAPAPDAANPKGNFVMCEICDGYIKDLEQLRTHMHWIHKVRIHPKMLANRPPLNCQKCQWRFFTDQGLERHLLGAHGLVTSNMQDMVNQNQDGGRCTICGRVFTNKLVTHMNQTHKINLKPAHLSYKCTVCSATFNLYRLFENHVYMVHSGSVKRNAPDDGASAHPRKKAAIEANGN